MNLYDFDKSGQDIDISSGSLKYQLPPAVRNNFVGIERIKRKPMPQVNTKNMDRLFMKKMKDLENYYTLEVDYLPIEKRPTLAELGAKGKNLYDLYNRVAKNAKNKGDITRPQRDPESEQIKETYILPEGMPPPTPEGEWKGYEDIPLGIPAGMPSLPDEEKYDTEDYEEVLPPKFDKDKLYDNKDEIKAFNERMKLLEDAEADEDYMSDDWDELEKIMKPEEILAKGQEQYDLIKDKLYEDEEDILEKGQEQYDLIKDKLYEDDDDQPIYDIPELPFMSGEQMEAPEREVMRDD